MKTRPVEVDIRDEANTRFWQFCDRALENGFEFGNRYQWIRIFFVTTLVCFKVSLAHSGSDDEAKPWLEEQDSPRNWIRGAFGVTPTV